MAVKAAARRVLAGRDQGHSDALRRMSIAGLSGFPRSGPDFALVGTELETTERAPFCRSRFLKVRNENETGSQLDQAPASTRQTGNRYEAKSAPDSASHARSSSALRKVAQLESKIMNRKKQMELQKASLGQKPLDEESVSSASSDKRSRRGKKYLKNYAATSGNTTLSNVCSKEEQSFQSSEKNVVVQALLGLDSDEEEMRKLMQSSLEISTGNENKRVLGSDSKRAGKKRKTPVSSGMAPHKAVSPTEVSTSSSSTDSKKSVLGQVNSPTPPASRSLSGGVVSSMKNGTVKVTLPRTGDTKQSQASPESDRSEIKSLDELFSEAADSEDSISSGSNDFKPNILSLDDLVPDIQMTQESSRNSPEDPLLVEKDSTSLKMASAGTGVDGLSKGNIESILTEAEISEHLSDVSADFSRHKQDYLGNDERSVSSEYSEDFERSSTDGESGSETSEEHSESREYSGKHPSPPSSPPLTRTGQKQAHRVTVRETGVQTVDPPFTYRWAKADGAGLASSAGNSYVEPVSIASHAISMDTVEALTTYRPSVLLLNSMLKQHVMLTRQFVENIHHLHLSLVESLENEQFHYHTLEEAKEYIKNHKPLL